MSDTGANKQRHTPAPLSSESFSPPFLSCIRTLAEMKLKDFGDPTPPDIEIAQGAILQPITNIAACLGLLEEEFDSYGKFQAKVGANPFYPGSSGDAVICDPSAGGLTLLQDGAVACAVVTVETYSRRCSCGCCCIARLVLTQGGRRCTCPWPIACKQSREAAMVSPCCSQYLKQLV